MISEKEAIDFLNNVLELPSHWPETLEQDKLGFLKLFMKHQVTRVPFQNITMSLLPKNGCVRKNRDIPGIISNGLSGNGGCCIEMNYFTKILFTTLGLDAFVIQGSYVGAHIKGTHCILVVRLSHDELYMVEMGGAYPLIEPIPLHKLPLKTLTAGGYWYEFREISNGRFGRFSIGGGLYGGDYVGKLESLQNDWDMVPRRFEEFDYAMFESYANPVSMMITGPLLLRYFFPGEIVNEDLIDLNSNGKPRIEADTNSDFVFVFGKRLIIGNATARKIIKNFQTYQEMAPVIKKYFPKLKLAEIEEACQVYTEAEVRLAKSPAPKLNLDSTL
jgi:hypothetical protein